MAGYKISIDNVRKLSRLNCDFEDIIREVMMSQGRRFCSFEKPKCEQEIEAQKTDTQHLKYSIALLVSLAKMLDEGNSPMVGGATHQNIKGWLTQQKYI